MSSGFHTVRRERERFGGLPSGPQAARIHLIVDEERTARRLVASGSTREARHFNGALPCSGVSGCRKGTYTVAALAVLRLSAPVEK